MTKRIAAACAAVALVFGAGLAPASAENVTTTALKTMLEGMPDTEAHVVTFDVDPGWKSDRHYHPGHVFVYVLEGTLHLEVDGQAPQDFTAGQAFYETPGVNMVGSNASTSERAKFIVFQFGDAGKPIMIAN